MLCLSLSRRDASIDKMLVSRSEKLFLEPEMVEQAALAHAGAGRDALKRDGGHPNVSNQLQRSVQDFVAGAGASAQALCRFRFAHANSVAW
jgi:hypothetical protein